MQNQTTEVPKTPYLRPELDAYHKNRSQLMFFTGVVHWGGEKPGEAPFGNAGYSFGARQVRQAGCNTLHVCRPASPPNAVDCFSTSHADIYRMSSRHSAASADTPPVTEYVCCIRKPMHCVL